MAPGREEESIVIVGAGMAGVKAAEGAREAGWQGRIQLVGAEPFLPYERPPLSKGILQGAEGPRAALIHDDGWEVAHEVELLLGARAESIDLAARRVQLAGGPALAFSSLVLATGCSARRPTLPGAQLEGVLTLRSLEDSLALRDRLLPGSRLVVIGTGWIGTEVAASARQRGVEVVLVGSQAAPLERTLGPEVGAFYGRLHRDHGVELRMGSAVTAIEGEERVTRVRLEDGALLAADTVVLGVGSQPETGLAEAAGLALGEGGVLADERLVTEHPRVLVAGDIAAAVHPVLGSRLRVEHWANALDQGLLAGGNAAGGSSAYDRIPYFFSDQYEAGMEYSGWPVPYDEVVFRGSPEAGAFVAFYLSGGVVVGGVNVNVWDVNEHVQALVRAGTPARRDVLADEGADPAEWVSAALA